MNRIRLNKEEAAWFSRNVLKMLINLESKAKREPEILSRTTYKTLNSLKASARLIGEATGNTQFDIVLDRKQKLSVRELIMETHRVLTQHVLPEYERRGGHERYITNGKEKAKKLSAMARKFK